MSLILYKTPSLFLKNLSDFPQAIAAPTGALWDQLLLEDALSNRQRRSSGVMTADDKEFRWSLDLPGVKVSDLEIQFLDDGNLSIAGARRIFTGNESTKNPVKKHRFSHILPLNPQEADASKIQANLSDGVLVITIPKVPEAQPITVSITSEPHKEDFEVVGAHVFSLDLPGVKAADLNIQVKDGKISINGSRRVVGRGKKQRFSHTRALHDIQEIDATKIKANLADGVLVITAPKKKAPKEQSSICVSVTTKPHKEEKDKEAVTETTATNQNNKEKEEDVKKDKAPELGKQ